MEKAKNQCQDVPEEEQVGGVCLFSYSKPMYEPSGCDLSKMRTRIPSVSDGSEAAACPPSPTASPSSSQKCFLPVNASLCMLALVLYYLTFQGTIL